MAGSRPTVEHATSARSRNAATAARLASEPWSLIASPQRAATSIVRGLPPATQIGGPPAVGPTGPMSGSAIV